MQRRRVLCLLGSSSVLGTVGCLSGTEPEPAGRDTESDPTTTAPQSSAATSPTTNSSRVRQWATEADSRDPVRPDGEPVSVDRTITDDPGYEQDNVEHFPQNKTVRYVSHMSGGEPAAYDTWSFEEWGRIESAEVGATRARTVTARRLGVEEVGSGMSSPPDEAETEGLVITVQISKTLSRDGEVVSWPVATFPDLKGAAPRSVDVTLSIEGDTFSRPVPVYVSYSVMHYD